VIRALLTTCAVLALMLAGAGARILALERAIAAKPKIEVRTVEKVRTVKVAGPVKVVEKITYLPGNGRVVERTIERDEVKTETGRDVVAERKEEAACPAPRRVKSRHFVAEFGPSGGGVPFGLRGGMSFLDALPVSPLIEAGYRRDGQDRVYGAAGIRF
jgi:hypothetical protein